MVDRCVKFDEFIDQSICTRYDLGCDVTDEIDRECVVEQE